MQSGALRDVWFEVVRFTVQVRYDSADEPWDEASYDLAHPSQVRRLLARQAAERATGVSSRVTVEFTYPLAGRQYAAIEAAYTDLTELRVVPAQQRVRHAGVRFPQASYHAESQTSPVRGRRRSRVRHWPGSRTFWTLGPPELSTASTGEAAPEAGQCTGESATA